MFLFNDKAPKKIKFNNKSVNTLIYNGIVVWTAKVLKAISGISPLTIGACADNQSIANYKMYGNSVQNGTPTPANPIEIDSVGEYDEASGKYKIPIVVRGKNIYPNDWEPGYIKVGSGVNEDSVSNIRTKGYFTFDKNQVYFISSNDLTDDNTITWFFYDENKTFISRITSRRNRTVSIETNSKNVKIPVNAVYYRLVANTTDTNVKVQLELGTSATEYEPYKEPITTDIYINKPLMGIGKAFDYIDFENQKVVRKIGNCLLGISAMREITHDTLISFYYLVPGKTRNCDSTKVEVLSSSLLGIPRNKNINLYNVPSISGNVTDNAVFGYLYREDVGDNTHVAIQNYLQANPITIYYELAEPTEESIDLPQLPNYEGTTVLEVNTVAKPNMDISYYTQGG